MSISISISKKDILWSYFAQFFSLASGIIILPLVLRLLSIEEIAMNYLMLTIGSLVSLFDFGFAPQFGRNITYIFSGAQKLHKEDIETVSEKLDINYKLLKTMISTAQFVYRRLALFVFVLMITLGSLYIYKVTNGFTNIENSFAIWIVYSISTFFNIYYSYYNSLLIGKGLITESKKAMVFSRIAYLILASIFLYLGIGLMGLAIANFVAPFLSRIISYHFFFTKEMKEKLNPIQVSLHEKKELFKIIWHNSKKLGLIFIGAYAITKLSMFLAGLFLPLEEVASYGLMIQLVGIIMTLSTTLFNTYNPTFSSLRIAENNKKLISLFAFTMNVYYVLFITGSVLLIFVAPWILQFIGSNAVLPTTTILILYCIVCLLEGNHSNFATMIVTKNRVPFLSSSLIAGGAIALGDYFVLSFTHFGILGLVFIQGVTQIAYANWKWPYVVCKEFGINFWEFLIIGFKETFFKIKTYCHGK